MQKASFALFLVFPVLCSLRSAPLDLDVFKQVKKWQKQAAGTKGARGTKEKPPIKILCEKTTTQKLLSRLGPAFNHRYMSVVKPPLATDSNAQKLAASLTRGFQNSEPVHALPHSPGPFAVNENFRRALSPRRTKRKAPGGIVAPCLKEVTWFDFGEDYFPRYIRMARCKRHGHSCFVFGRCRAKAFTVQLLRRRSDGCVPEVRTEIVHRTLGELTAAKLAPHLANISVPVKYERVIMVEEWKWEEHAVTFCCECIYCRGNVCL